jgi:hypothetical protein
MGCLVRRGCPLFCRFTGFAQLALAFWTLTMGMAQHDYVIPVPCVYAL